MVLGILLNEPSMAKKDVLKVHSLILSSAMEASLGEQFFTTMKIYMNKFTDIDTDALYTLKWEFKAT